jgi:hypothetical protein
MLENKNTILVLAIFVLVLFITRVFAFSVISDSGKELKWKGVPSFVFSQEGSSDFLNGYDGTGSKVSDYDAILQGFKSWEDVTGTSISFTNKGFIEKNKSGYDGTNLIVFVKEGWMNLDFNPPAQALAVTVTSFDYKKGEIVDADIHFNNEFFSWAVVDTKDDARKIDLTSIATHEIGHFFGLDHSSNNPMETNEELAIATMYFAAVPGDVSGRTLEIDDVLGIMHLYPQVEGAIPSLQSINPSSGSNTGYARITNISGDSFEATATARLVLSDSAGPDIIISDLIIENSKISGTADLRNAIPGMYDLVVANTVGRESILKEAFLVNGDGPYDQGKYYYYESTGCGYVQIYERENFILIIIFLSVILSLVYLRNRLSLSKQK